MSVDKHPEEPTLISLSDMTAIFRRAKKQIIWCALIMGLLGALFALSRPIRYKAEGTFREKSTKSGNLGSSIGQFLMHDGVGGGVESEATVLIKSRKLMKDVIEQMSLQGDVVPKYGQDGLFKRMRNQLKVEWTYLSRSPYPPLADHPPLLKIEKIQYPGEIPLLLEMELTEANQYQVYNSQKESLGEGHLGSPFVNEAFAFTLIKAGPKELQPQQFYVVLRPLADTANSLIKTLEIEAVKTDKGVLKLSYSHPDRHVASQFINTVMFNYQTYLQENHKRIANIQLKYLDKRRGESGEELKQLMQQHAEFLAADLSDLGFADSRKEMDFLAETQHELKEKLLSNELEIKRLNNIQPHNYALYDRYTDRDSDASIINSILTEIRHSKQDRDGLELALRNHVMAKNINLEEAFQQQMEELHQIQKYKQELVEIVKNYEADSLPNFSLALMQDSRYSLKGWFDQLSKFKEDESHLKQVHERLPLYLSNLNRLLNVHEKILHERLTHQQSPSEEYQGINLRTANELYMDYSKRLSEEESNIQRTQFFLEQMQDPNFEVTSLSPVLRDPVSTSMITRANELVLTLKDQMNQSTREQERLQKDLNLQRSFLALHLKQTLQLMELNKKSLQEKIYALQNISLELLHQQVSLLEKNLNDYMQSRLENLKQEREIIKQHLEQIQHEMSLLPKRWTAEQFIQQQVDINKLIVKEIAGMVETKNISHNLEVIQSAPIDLALPPLHPNRPGLMLYTLLGCLLGGLMGAGFALIKSLSDGTLNIENSTKLKK